MIGILHSGMIFFFFSGGGVRLYTLPLTDVITNHMAFVSQVEAPLYVVHFEA